VPWRRDREISLDELEVRDVLTGELGSLRLQGDELDVEPVAPVRLRNLGGQARAQGDGVVLEAGRGPRLLHVDL
jgi:hypothetical protein